MYESLPCVYPRSRVRFLMLSAPLFLEIDRLRGRPSVLVLLR